MQFFRKARRQEPYSPTRLISKSTREQKGSPAARSSAHDPSGPALVSPWRPASSSSRPPAPPRRGWRGTSAPCWRASCSAGSDSVTRPCPAARSPARRGAHLVMRQALRLGDEQRAAHLALRLGEDVPVLPDQPLHCQHTPRSARTAPTLPGRPPGAARRAAPPPRAAHLPPCPPAAPRRPRCYPPRPPSWPPPSLSREPRSPSDGGRGRTAPRGSAARDTCWRGEAAAAMLVKGDWEAGSPRPRLRGGAICRRDRCTRRGVA